MKGRQEMKKCGRYSNEFEGEVLRMAETSDKPIVELERDLGLSTGLIMSSIVVNTEVSSLLESEVMHPTHLYRGIDLLRAVLAAL